MIVFDLKCGGGHIFEAWFGSSGDYADQRKRGLIACPICDDGAVEKAAMAPAVPAKGSGSGSGSSMVVPHALGGDPAKMKAMLHALAKAQAKALEGSSWVGDRFASEARAIHDGEKPAAAIHGQATVAEARALADDGIAVAPLPLPVRPPETEN